MIKILVRSISPASIYIYIEKPRGVHICVTAAINYYNLRKGLYLKNGGRGVKIYISYHL